MNTRAFTLALIIALGAMFMVYTYIEEQKSSIIKKFGQEVAVVVAKVDINELDLIDDTKVTVARVPRKFAAPGHFKEIKEVQNTVASVPILKGEQVTKPRITYPGARTGLSRQVSAGKRAVSIDVTAATAVSKLIKPGDRIDIIAGIDYGDGDMSKRKVKTILQDVLILATGISMTNSVPIYGVKTPRVIKAMKLNTYTQFGTITLELTPFQVQQLIYLKNFTKEIYFSLRNNNDKQIVRINSTNLFDLLGEDSAEAKAYFMKKDAKRSR